MTAIAWRGLHPGQRVIDPSRTARLPHGMPEAEPADLPAGFAEGCLRNTAWSAAPSRAPVCKIIADPAATSRSLVGAEDDGEQGRSLAAS